MDLRLLQVFFIKKVFFTFRESPCFLTIDIKLANTFRSSKHKAYALDNHCMYQFYKAMLSYTRNRAF